MVLRTFFPLTAFKNARNPKFVQKSKICPSDCFGGVPVRGTEIWKNLSKFVRKLPFLKFGQIFPNFSSPDWNPPKQSLGQILHKCGVKRVRKNGAFAWRALDAMSYNVLESGQGLMNWCILLARTLMVSC